MQENGKKAKFYNECKIVIHFSARRYVKRQFEETNNNIKSGEFGAGHHMS